jgi:hypothetical protein
VEKIDDGSHIYLKGTHNSKKMKEYFDDFILKRGEYSRVDKVLMGIKVYLKARKDGYRYL